MSRPLKDRVGTSSPVRFVKNLRSAGPTILAGAIAYDLFFALVPGVASLVVLASVAGRTDEVLSETLSGLERVLPAETARFVSDVLDDVATSVSSQQTTVAIITGTLALWLASRGIHTIQKALARIAHQDEHRKWIVAKLISVLLTAAMALALVTTVLLVVGGAAVAQGIEESTDQTWPVSVWNAASLPLAVIMIFFFLAALYRFGPPQRFPGMWLAATFSTLGSILASLGFRFYIDEVGETGATTLAIFGAVAVVLLWLYLIAYVIIVSGVVAAGMTRMKVRRQGISQGDVDVDDLPQDEMEPVATDS